MPKQRRGLGRKARTSCHLQFALAVWGLGGVGSRALGFRIPRAKGFAGSGFRVLGFRNLKNKGFELQEFMS